MKLHFTRKVDRKYQCKTKWKKGTTTFLLSKDIAQHFEILLNRKRDKLVEIALSLMRATPQKTFCERH